MFTEISKSAWVTNQLTNVTAHFTTTQWWQEPQLIFSLKCSWFTMSGSFLLWCIVFRYIRRCILFYSLPYCGFRLPTPVFLGFPCGSAGKESACNEGDLGLIPDLGRSPGKGKGYPLWYSGLENSTDYIVHGVTKSRTRLSDFHFLLWFITGYGIQFPVPYRQTLLFIHPICNSLRQLIPNS